MLVWLGFVLLLVLGLGLGLGLAFVLVLGLGLVLGLARVRVRVRVKVTRNGLHFRSDLGVVVEHRSNRSGGSKSRGQCGEDDAGRTCQG